MNDRLEVNLLIYLSSCTFYELVSANKYIFSGRDAWAYNDAMAKLLFKKFFLPARSLVSGSWWL